MPETSPPATTVDFRIGLQLRVRSLQDAAWQLTNHIGFKSERAYQNVRNLPANCTGLRMRRLNQVIELKHVGENIQPGTGPIDHVALNTLDLHAAVIAIQAKWGSLDAEITPDGPAEISQFWDKGANFVFIQGPESARIELCNKVGEPGAEQQEHLVNIGPHDHIGICCPDLTQSRDFYTELGLQLVGEFAIPTPDGDINVNFLRRGDFMIELFSTPQARSDQLEFSDHPAWSALLFESQHHKGTPRQLSGPSGELVEIRQLDSNDAFEFQPEDLQC